MATVSSVLAVFIGVGLALLGTPSRAEAPPIDSVTGAETLLMAPFDGLGERTLMAVRLPSGEARLLRPGDTDWIAGESLFSDIEEARFALRDQSVREIRRGAPDRVWRKQATIAREMSVRTSRGVLSRTLLQPPGPAPFPAVVLVHGSGPLTMESFGFWPLFFVSRGYAVAVYDKRGAGKSAPRVDPGMAVLGDDAAAVLAWVRGQPSVKRAEVGLFGVSQGGYVSLLAAARGARPDFIISVGGMMVSGAEQEVYRVGAETAADGLHPRYQAEAAAYTGDMLARGRQGLAPTKRPPVAAPWRPYVFEPESDRDAAAVWASDWSFDIRPFLKMVATPVLAVYGAHDRSSPIGPSLASLTSGLPRSTCLHGRVLPDSDHSLLRSRSGGRGEVPKSPGFAPETFTVIEGWLRAPVCENR